MRLRSLTSFSVIVLSALTAFSAPPAASGPGSVEFKKALDAADRAYTTGAYLQSVAQLREAIDVANESLRDALMEAMPLAPNGYRATATEAPNPQQVRDPLMAALAMSSSRPIERRYEQADGPGRVRIVIAPNAPSAPMVAKQIQLSETDNRYATVIVGKSSGVLVKNALGTALRFAIAEKHLLEIQADNVDDDKLRAMVDERTLTRLTALLSQ